MIFNIQIDGGVNTKDGTAMASDILNGKIAYVGKEKIVGSMKNNGDVDSAIVSGVLQEGYTSGGTIQNLSSENIRDGIVICGKIGTMLDGTRLALKKTHIKSGQYLYTEEYYMDLDPRTLYVITFVGMDGSQTYSYGSTCLEVYKVIHGAQPIKMIRVAGGRNSSDPGYINFVKTDSSGNFKISPYYSGKLEGANYGTIILQIYTTT